MTIEEMHLDVKLKLDAMYSNTFAEFTGEEIDWVLNEHVLKYIEYRSNPRPESRMEGFEETTKRYDNLESLIAPDVLLPVINNSKGVYAFLPADYFKLVNKQVGVVCGTSTATVTSSRIYYVPLLKDVSSVTSLTITYSVQGETPIILFDKADLTADIIDSNYFVILRQLIVDSIIAKADNKLVAAYESLHSRFSSKDELIIRTYNSAASITVRLNGQFLDIATFTDTNETTSGTPTFVEGRLVKHEDVYTLLRNPIGTTKLDSPLVTLQDGLIQVYTNGKFNVSGIQLTYVKTPNKVNRRFGVNLGIGSRTGQNRNICRQIVDATVSTIAGRIASGVKPVLEKDFYLTD